MPIRISSEGVAVVHNGIIENFSELRDELDSAGATFKTQTDTEVVAHLMAKLSRTGMNHGCDACDAAPRDRCLCAGRHAQRIPDTIMAARNGPPLAVGYGKGEMFLGSDAIALSPFTNEITYLIDGDWAVLTADGRSILDLRRQAEIQRPRQMSVTAAYMVDKGNHRHFMEKEITSSRRSSRTRSAITSISCEQHGQSDRCRDRFQAKVPALPSRPAARPISRPRRQILVRALRAPAGRNRCRLGIPLSRSRCRRRGRALHLAVRRDRRYAGIAALLQGAGPEDRRRRQRQESTIARESDAIFPIMAGPEIGVASTKAFTCQLIRAGMRWRFGAGKARGTSVRAGEATGAPSRRNAAHHEPGAECSIQPRDRKLARELSKCKDVLYLGRGTSYPLAWKAR
jgi:glucosamine--fructose-6-phosphate aminotransferase (isomerizing)